jgi:hypothetical protein
MDKLEALIFTSEIAACILANVSTADVELIELSEGMDPLAEFAERKGRGLACVGAVTLQRNGQVRTAFDVPLPDSTVRALSAAFVQLVAARCTARAADSGEDWLERLHSLPDPREN